MKQLLEYIRNFYQTHNVYRELGLLTEGQQYRKFLAIALKPEEYSDPTAPFKAFITPELAKRLRPIDQKSETIQGQEEIIKKAGEGDRDCALYLYIDFLGIICSVFHEKLYKVITKNNSQSINEDDLNNLTYEMVTIALEMLSGGTPGEIDGRHANVYRTFNPEVYTKRDKNFDLLSHFGFYFQQYLKDEVTYMLRRYWNQGVTGVAINQFAPNQTSYEGMVAGMNHDTDDFVSNNDALSLSASEDLDTKMTVNDAFKAFEAFLATKPDGNLYLTIWRLKGLAMTPEQISKETGLNKYSIQKMWKNIQNWFTARYKRDDFRN